MRTKLILLGIVIIILLVFSMPFWYLISPFYYQCMKVKQGMPTTEAEKIMAHYLDNRNVFVTRDFRSSAKTVLESPGLYMATKGTDMRCLFSYEGDKVKDIEFYYD